MRPGEVIAGRYRIEAPLGRGGMGAVFRATDQKLSRSVAIKVLHLPATASAEQRATEIARFAREAAAGTKLSHPNIVKLLDAGETSEGVPFIAMELVEGVTLQAILAVDRAVTTIPRETRLGWLVDIARGLAAAHRAGIVHRDLKPANVMITAGVRATILDFGIARLAGAMTLTEEGFQPGTPRYMAPEQRVGLRVDARADQYAWGLIGYEVLTGRRVASGEVFDGWADPTEPLSPVVGRAMRQDVEARFASMEMLLASLSPPPSPSQHRRRPRHRVVFALSLASTIVMFGLVGWAVLRLRAPPPVVRSVADASPSTSMSASETAVESEESDPGEAVEPSAGASAKTAQGARSVTARECACRATAGHLRSTWCLTRMPQRCFCNGRAMRMCSTPQWPCPSERFDSEAARPGGKCTGYIMVNGKHKPEPGFLECSVCYGSHIQRGRGKHLAPCQGIDTDGSPVMGVWDCDLE